MPLAFLKSAWTFYGVCHETLDVTFTREDWKGIVLHEDGRMVLSIVIVGRNVHRVLIN